MKILLSLCIAILGMWNTEKCSIYEMSVEGSEYLSTNYDLTFYYDQNKIIIDTKDKQIYKIFFSREAKHYDSYTELWFKAIDKHGNECIIVIEKHYNSINYLYIHYPDTYWTYKYN